jgi:hypothetical protein
MATCPSREEIAMRGRPIVFALVMLVMTPGCKPRAGDTGGRIDSYETTDADRRSNSASLPALLEFGDRAAQQLATELADVPEIAGREELAVLEVGTITNSTNTPTQDFEQMQRRLRHALRKSPTIREQFLLVEPVERMGVEKRRETGDGPADLLMESGPRTGTDRYDPADTFVLQADLSEARRGDRVHYYMTFQLTNVKSRQIVFTHSVDLGVEEEEEDYQPPTGEPPRNRTGGGSRIGPGGPQDVE